MHNCSSQSNEAMNQSVARYAPKNKAYGTSMSLTYRVMIAVGIRNMGFLGLWEEVHIAIRLPLSMELESYLRGKDKAKESKKEYNEMESNVLSSFNP